MRISILHNKYLLLLLVCLATGRQLSAQADTARLLTYRFLSVEDGLASRVVLCALQDSCGFMWFGTRSGLNKYDGGHFTLVNDQNSKLRRGRVIAIAEDDAGKLWITYCKEFKDESTGEVDLPDIDHKQ